MSNIILQFGQCGNQIGQALYHCIYEDIKYKTDSLKLLNNEYVNESTNQWFSTNKGQLEARAVLIDTEEKVTSLVNKKKAYKFKNIVYSSYGGSANNWAFGYTSRSSFVVQNVMEKLRNEIEKCDFTSCFLNILSSSGGTGSGVGSRTIELIRDEFPSKFITNIIMLPFKKGDTVTQSYNTLLTLAKLYDITDNTILFENDKMYEISRSLIPSKEIKLSDLNQVISHHLASVMQPVKNSSFCKLISSISCHPSYKFVQIKAAPQVSFDNIKYESVPIWTTLVNQLFKNYKADIQVNSNLCKRMKYIGNVLITRGNIHKQDIDVQKLHVLSKYVSWVPENEKLVYYSQPRQFLAYQKFVSLITNNNNICDALDFILDDAWNLFTHGAYLHHYNKYNITDDYFLEAFQKLENVLNDYKLL